MDSADNKPTQSSQPPPKGDIDLHAYLDLMHGCFLLQLGLISNDDWLRRLTVATKADGAACVRWTTGRPEHALVSSSGNYRELPAGWKTWVDHAVAQSSREEPGYIQDFLATTGNSETHDLEDPHCLIAIADWQPACITFILLRDDDNPPWSEREKEAFKQNLEPVRHSIQVHKQIDSHRHTGLIAHDILNSSPRGIIALAENGDIKMVNTKAEEILQQKDGIEFRDNTLSISDPHVADTVADYLANIARPQGAELPAMDWNMAIKRPSGKPDLQFILGSIKLREWNLESGPADRVAIIYLHDPQDTTRPTVEQLQKFYGFTKAQARIADALYSGISVSQAAKELNISVNTVRTHLRNIYAKVGVKTQTELLGLLTSGLKTYGSHKD